MFAEYATVTSHEVYFPLYQQPTDREDDAAETHEEAVGRLFYLMSSGYFTTFMKEHAGGTTTPIIYRSIWDTIMVPLPPLAGQRRIVAKLEELLLLCER